MKGLRLHVLYDCPMRVIPFVLKSVLKPSNRPEEYVEYSYNFKSSDNHINYEEGF
jgi:hypothetical protein